MSWGFPVSIRNRLRLAFLLMLLAGIFQGITGMWATLALSAVSAEAAGKRLPASVSLQSLGSATANFRIAQFQYTLAADADRPAMEGTMASLLERIANESKALESTLTSDTMKTAEAAFAQAWHAYLIHDESIRRFMADGLPLQATDLLNGEARAAYEQSQQALEQLGTVNANQAAALRDQAETRRDLAYLTTGVAVALTLAAGLGLAWPVVLRLQRTLTLAQQSARTLAQGQLRFDHEVRGQDELSDLMAAMQSMARHWNRLVIDIRNAAQQVASASHEVAQGSADLSQRTEQQSANVQELASLVSMLEGSAQDNHVRAQTAEQLSRDSANDARRNTQTLQALQTSIQHVNDGAHRISSISTLIDAIANQTNILALNAAVEAARAGAHGRGFAVVAGEVRQLAQQSAQAARDIKQIVQDSLEHSNHGAQQAERALSDIAALANNAEQTVDGVGLILQTSHSQAQGVAQMNGRTTDIDQAMQQNAALVEELTAAAHAMREQAQCIVALMQNFVVDEADHPPLLQS